MTLIKKRVHNTIHNIKKIIVKIPIIGNIILNIKKKLIRIFWNIKIYRLYKTKNGNFYLPLCAYKDEIRNEIKNNRIYQPEVIDIAKQYVKENTAVLDVGSNYGQMTIEFSRLKKNVVVYSFEAQKFIYKLLKKNIHINNVNAKCFYNLVGNENKIVKIKTDKLNNFDTWGSNYVEIIQNEKNFNYIKAVKIDDLIIKEKISFMKIDIQGRDLDALKGAKKTILNNKMPILFEYEKTFEDIFQYKFKDYENFIEEINYKIHFKTLNDYLILPRK